MPLDVIGPGFGRTGTASLKRALEMLGFGPCHHMEDVFARPEQVPHWIAVAEGRPVDWEEVFAGYRSQVDWPGAHAWRAIARAFPQAKVLLSVRPEEAWWRSFSATIGALLTRAGGPPPEAPPHRKALAPAMRAMIEDQTFGAPASDRAAALAAYRRRAAEVRAEIAPERLLVFDVAEGWEPLCRFLDVPIPNQPFPHVNTTEDFWRQSRGTPPKEG